jgi:hypothetical protein
MYIVDVYTHFVFRVPCSHSCRQGKEFKSVRPHEEDEDVARERQRVQSGDAAEDVLRISNLSKVRPRLTTVTTKYSRVYTTSRIPPPPSHMCE